MRRTHSGIHGGRSRSSTPCSFTMRVGSRSSLAGEKDVLGLWVGTGGEGAKFWMSVLTDIKNRGVTDTFFLVCDGLKGLPDVVANVWPRTTVQTCILHLIRNTFKARLEEGLGRAQTRREADLYRPEPERREGSVGGAR